MVEYEVSNSLAFDILDACPLTDEKDEKVSRQPNNLSRYVHFQCGKEDGPRIFVVVS